jgi:glycosyltransferase involved in cell wall biosynthesis
MRVAIVSDYLPRFHKIWSGAELLAVTLGDVLPGRDCETLLLTTPWDFVPDGNQDNVCAIRTPAKRFGTLSRNFPIDVVALWQLYRKLKKYKPDVVHINAKYLLLPAIIACSRLNIPTVFTVPDYFMFCPTTFIRRPDASTCTLYHGARCCDCLSNLDSGFARKILAVMPRFLTAAVLALRAKQFDYFLKKVDAYIALTEVSRQRLIGYGIPEEKISVIYHYKLAEPRETDAAISSPSAVFVGWLSEENGADILTKAFALTAAEVPDARLYLVGTGNDALVGRIEEQIARDGIAERVVFLGKRDNEETLSIISRCDVVVVPHQWAKEFGPVVLLEAMTLGKPVIASRIGAVRQFIHHGVDGVTVEDFTNPGAFADELTKLLSSAELALEMGQKARESAGTFFGASCRDKLLSLYASLSDHKER